MSTDILYVISWYSKSTGELIQKTEHFGDSKSLEIYLDTYYHEDVHASENYDYVVSARPSEY